MIGTEMTAAPVTFKARLPGKGSGSNIIVFKRENFRSTATATRGYDLTTEGAKGEISTASGLRISGTQHTATFACFRQSGPYSPA